MDWRRVMDSQDYIDGPYKTLGDRLSYAIKERCGDITRMTGTLKESDLDIKETADWPNFTVWCDGWVYFPVVYDGFYWVESVPAMPCDYASPILGGGHSGEY